MIVTNSSGTFVYSGDEMSAKILTSEILLENGVMYVVDRLMNNMDSDAAAASLA